LRVDIGARTDVGRIRSNNEDCYCVMPSLNLFVLSDGMGGEVHGEIASAIVVETVTEHCMQAANNLHPPYPPLFRKPRPELSEKTNRLASAVHWANRKIHLAATKNPAQRGMGATVLAAWLDGQRLSLVNVGDSRAYLLRGGALQQLTADHSLAAERARRGFLTQQQADSSALQNVLLRALGTDKEVEVDANEHPLVDGDAVLLCTDGLTRMVPRPEIAGTLITCPSAQAGADRLVALASHHGGKDNVTVVVLRIELGGDSVLGRLLRWLRGSGGLLDAASSAGGR